MKLLLLGSGGREHALAWKIAQSPKVEKLYIAPGNAGTAEVGENVAIKADDFDGIGRFVLEHAVDMVVVGPEDPLVKGVYDYFKSDSRLANIPVIGPSAKGAVLEGSKEFAKGFIDIQRTSFRRLGVFGDWENPYLTMKPAYEANILRVFAKLVEDGAVYQSRKPVQWSYGAYTALAEAEIDYKEKVSTSVFVPSYRS